MIKRIFQKPFYRCLTVHGLFPSLFYLIMFCLLTYPLITTFSTHFFGDIHDDVLQNVWNIWWIDWATLHPNVYPSIWQTNFLHWPYGTTLIGQTLNPFNGYLAVLLLRFLSLTETYNSITIFAFVAGGLTAYWLSYYLTRSFWGSILAGFLFTFSGYHFAHAHGHMNLVSLEWIPLFILCWHLLITKPNTIAAVGAAVVLWMVFLSDYYYFLYCIFAAVLILLLYTIIQKNPFYFFRKEYLVPLLTFLGIAMLLMGPIISTFIISNYRDPLLGSHDPLEFSLDPLSLIIPGGGWIFNSLTKPYWSELPGNIYESNVYLGLTVYILMGYVLVKRKALEQSLRHQAYLWFMVIGFFFLLALGPALRIAGNVMWHKAMPYTLLVYVFPFLRISGVPVRMVVMVSLGASVIAAIGLQELLRRFQKNKIFIFALLGLLVIETLPSPINGIKIEVPEYITALAGLPNDGGVADLLVSDEGLSLYYQTIHQKPIVFGYLSRIPESVYQQDRALSAILQNREYCTLWDTYHIRYIITFDTIPTDELQPYVSIRIVFTKADLKIYRIGCECESGLSIR
jgi:hypothetical protein